MGRTTQPSVRASVLPAVVGAQPIYVTITQLLVQAIHQSVQESLPRSEQRIHAQKEVIILVPWVPCLEDAIGQPPNGRQHEHHKVQEQPLLNPDFHPSLHQLSLANQQNYINTMNKLNDLKNNPYHFSS